MKLVTGKERWFVIQAFTGSEDDIADELHKAGIHAYFPRYKKEVRRKHGFRTVIKPLLPSYLFVAEPEKPEEPLMHMGKPVHWRKRISDTDDVVGFLKNQGEPITIDGELVLDIQVRETEGEFDEMITDKDGKEQMKVKFPVGSKAELTAGTFAMLVGKVLKHEKTGRIKLEVDVYGRAFVVDSDPEKLRPAA